MTDHSCDGPFTRVPEDKGDDDEGPLFCDVSGQAAYPTMKVVDARSALLSPHDLWKQFNLGALNYELSTPLSPAQVGVMLSYFCPIYRLIKIF